MGVDAEVGWLPRFKECNAEYENQSRQDLKGAKHYDKCLNAHSIKIECT